MSGGLGGGGEGGGCVCGVGGGLVGFLPFSKIAEKIVNVLSWNGQNYSNNMNETITNI